VETRNKRYLLLALAAAVTFSCAPGVRMGGRGKGLPPAKYVETFFKGEGKTLYFVKPLPWKDIATGDQLLLDITYDSDPEKVTQPILRFSFASEKMVVPVTSIELKGNDESHTCQNPEKVFVEPGKKGGFMNRYECSITFDELKGLVKTSSPHLLVTHQGGTHEYAVTPKWERKIAGFLQLHVIDMVELEKAD
jgi:hypothetical protein